MITLLELQRMANRAFPGERITAAHLLIAWADDERAELADILGAAGLEIDALKDALRPLIAEPAEEDQAPIRACIHSVSEGSVTGWHLLNALENRPSHRITQALVEAGMDLDGLRQALADRVPKSSATILHSAAAKTSPLQSYGRDLTAEAANGAFDDLCDRPGETEKLLRVLLRKQKANPVLTGPAGVGKTALVELLARDLANEAVPEKLIGTRMFELSMGRLVAGTKYRGEFEERFETVMRTLKQAEPAILFIDEFHLVWGAGRAEGAPMDAANMLKPLLNRGELRIIGATTSEEYHQYVSRDAALARRFEELPLEEPDEALLMELVKKQRQGLAEYHGIAIPDAILPRAVELADLHLPNRHQPDKTVNLLDSSAVNTVSRGGTELTEDDLLQSLEAQTGRPLTRLDEHQRLSLLEVSQRLSERIVGQEEAIKKVASTLVYRRQHLGEAEQNLGSFLFIGSTGVGKTETARAVATVLFGSEKALLRLDMSEYSSYGAPHKLIGTPLAHAPTEEAGILTDWLYRRGSGVILFDEIEKANREVHHLLLGMLDRGRIRDARGDELDTRQCVIILTSNALKPEALKETSIGFSQGDGRRDPVELLAAHFPHEFLGRLDEVVLFRDLDSEQLKQILKMRLEEGLSRFEEKGVSVHYDEERLLEYLYLGLKAAKSSGARGIERLLERLLLQPLAVELAAYGGDKPATMTVDDAFYDDGTVEIRPQKRPEGV